MQKCQDQKFFLLTDSTQYLMDKLGNWYLTIPYFYPVIKNISDFVWLEFEFGEELKNETSLQILVFLTLMVIGDIRIFGWRLLVAISDQYEKEINQQNLQNQQDQRDQENQRNQRNQRNRRNQRHQENRPILHQRVYEIPRNLGDL